MAENENKFRGIFIFFFKLCLKVLRFLVALSVSGEFFFQKVGPLLTVELTIVSNFIRTF